MASSSATLGIAGLSVALMVFCPLTSAQQRSSDAVNGQSQEILDELRAIRLLLERLTLAPQLPNPPRRPATARIESLAGYFLGERNAPLTIVEFTDSQCPFCRQYVTSTFAQLKERWIDTGKLQYISRDFPLDFHSEAMSAARAARCSGEQGKFWDMRILLVKNGHVLSRSFIEQTARQLGMDMQEFAECLASSRHDADIRSDIEGAIAVGVTGTPTFIVGRTPRAGPFEGAMIVGAVSYSVLESKLTELLEGSQTTK